MLAFTFTPQQLRGKCCFYFIIYLFDSFGDKLHHKTSYSFIKDDALLKNSYNVIKIAKISFTSTNYNSKMLLTNECIVYDNPKMEYITI